MKNNMSKKEMLKSTDVVSKFPDLTRLRSVDYICVTTTSHHLTIHLSEGTKDHMAREYNTQFTQRTSHRTLHNHRLCSSWDQKTGHLRSYMLDEEAPILSLWPGSIDDLSVCDLTLTSGSTLILTITKQKVYHSTQLDERNTVVLEYWLCNHLRRINEPTIKPRPLGHWPDFWGHWLTWDLKFRYLSAVSRNSLHLRFSAKL